MKKMSLIGILLVVFLGIGFYLYQDNYGTTPYYTKINQQGERVNSGDIKGEPTYRYDYHLNSVNKKKEQKNINFYSFEDRPLRENAYLKVHVNKKKGVMGWEEIQKSELTEDILAVLD